MAWRVVSHRSMRAPDSLVDFAHRRRSRSAPEDAVKRARDRLMQTVRRCSDAGLGAASVDVRAIREEAEALSARAAGGRPRGEAAARARLRALDLRRAALRGSVGTCCTRRPSPARRPRPKRARPQLPSSTRARARRAAAARSIEKVAAGARRRRGPLPAHDGGLGQVRAQVAGV